MPRNTTTAAAKYSLTLDGVDCGGLIEVSGGGISAPVVEEKVVDGFAEKHIGPPTYEDFLVDVGLGGAPELYAWISSAWTPSPPPRNGSIVAAGVDGKRTSERRFTNALITGVTVPRLDASSKDAGRLTVRFRPELIRTQPASGTDAAAKQAKKWLVSNFRLELDGIDTTRVASIDTFTVTHDVVQEPGARQPTVRAGVLEFPNLLVSVAASHVQTWETWFQDFVIDGNNDASKEKSGALVFLGPDLKAELGRIVLHNVGICALRPAIQSAAAEQVARVSVELYCDRMELHVDAPAPAPVPTPPVIPRRPVVPVEPVRRPVVPGG
jgi:hypothetical protein